MVWEWDFSLPNHSIYKNALSKLIDRSRTDVEACLQTNKYSLKSVSVQYPQKGMGAISLNADADLVFGSRISLNA